MDRYDSWLEQPFQEQCEREAEFHEQVEELLDGEYSIKNFANFTEALCDECLNDRQSEIEEALANHDTKRLGQIIYGSVYQWLEVRAQREVLGD